MAALSTIMLGALAGTQAIGQFSAQRRQAKITEQEGEYAAGAYEQNAALAELQATDTIARGREAEGDFRTRAKVTAGGVRAGLAAQGVDIGTGSALDVQRDLGALSELDALTIRNNAAREAWGYRVQAGQYQHHAAMTRAAAKNQAKAMRNASLGSLLTGAATIYGVTRGGK